MTRSISASSVISQMPSPSFVVISAMIDEPPGGTHCSLNAFGNERRWKSDLRIGNVQRGVVVSRIGVAADEDVDAASCSEASPRASRASAGASVQTFSSS